MTAATAAPARKRAAAKKATPPRPKADPVEPVVFDLDAAKAARAESKRDPFTFAFGGGRYTIPPAVDWPIEAADLLSEGHIREAMKCLLDDQWAEFSKARATLGDLNDLFASLSAWQGLSPGE